VHAFITGLQQVIYASFCLLSLLTLRDWLRHRDRPRARVAVAIGTLALVVVASDVDTLTGARYVVPAVATQVLFPWSGYAFLLVRDAFVPLRRGVRIGVGVVVGAVALSGVYFAGQTTPDGARVALPLLYYGIWLGLWSACVIEPIVKFWVVSTRRRSVQRARLRALSIGYGLVIVILAFSFATRAQATNPAVQLVIQLTSLAVVPTLYASFAPPRWLRVIWRQDEEEALAGAIHGLLLSSTDAERLLTEALDWAMRLVGADGALVRHQAGTVIAAGGLDSLSGDTISVPLTLDGEPAELVVMPGPTTPLFGADEVSRLSQFAVVLSTALERARLVESLERRVTERTEALEAKASELEAFSYTVSHDLRAPIRAISGFAQAVVEDYASSLPDGARSFIDRIAENAVKMGTLIDTVLAFSRLGRQDLMKRTVRPTEIVATVLRNRDAEIRELSVAVTVGDLPDCYADPTLLEQVYENLIGNAIKYSANVNRPLVEIGCHDSTYFVRDNGAGFDMRHAAKLFEVFQRLHRQDEFAGVGAGLAIVKRIVERHGGRVWAESEPGAGATFYFTLGSTR